MTNTMPTTAASWRKPREEGFIITLPSGNVAKLRPIALDVLIMSGNLPDILTPIAAKTLWVEDDISNVAEVPELAKGFAELINFLLPAAFIEPCVITEGNPEGDEILVDDIEFADKVAVFNLVTSGATTLTKFREKQISDVAALSDSKKHSVKTKRATGNS